MNKDDIYKKFNELLKDEDYAGLGWFFWNGFLLDEGTERNQYIRLWDSLNKKQQALCDGIEEE